MWYFLDTACMSLYVCVFLSVLIRYTDEFVCFQVCMVRCLILYSVLVGCTVRMCDCWEAVLSNVNVAIVCVAQSWSSVLVVSHSLYIARACPGLCIRLAVREHFYIGCGMVIFYRILILLGACLLCNLKIACPADRSVCGGVSSWIVILQQGCRRPILLILRHCVVMHGV